MGVLAGGQASALRRLDDLAADVSTAEISTKQLEAASSAKLDLHAHVSITLYPIRVVVKQSSKIA